MNLEDEIACARRLFERKVEQIKEAAEIEERAEDALKELEDE